MKIMFLDESGDHRLTTIDPAYPVFVLGGVIMEEEYARNTLEPLIGQLKRKLFGRDDLILHTADIVRNRNGFERLIEPPFRQRFYEALNAFMRTLDYQVVACAVKKDAHLAEYGRAGLDPYRLSLEKLVERFCLDIGNNPGGGLIIIEKRGPASDKEMELAWLNLKNKGTVSIQAREIEERIVGLEGRQKQDNIAGLQLADLVVSPIGRFVQGKSVKEDFKIIQSKFRKDKMDDYRDAGLVILPKE